MSYNTDLQNNNTSLQEILATVNSLPEAGGSSGGGAEIETCTVNITGDVGLFVYSYTAYENGTLVPKCLSDSYSIGTTVTLENVVCGSGILIGTIIHFSYVKHNFENATLIYHNTVAGSYSAVCIQAPLTNGVANITLKDNL